MPSRTVRFVTSSFTNGWMFDWQGVGGRQKPRPDLPLIAGWMGQYGASLSRPAALRCERAPCRNCVTGLAMDTGASQLLDPEAPDISAYLGGDEQVLISDGANSADLAFESDTKGEGWVYLTNQNLWFVVEGHQQPWACVGYTEITDLKIRFVLLPGMRTVIFLTSAGVQFRFALGKTVSQMLRQQVDLSQRQSGDT